MNKTEVAEQLQNAHRELEDAIAQVGEARMTEPGVVGEWSVKDLLAHITFWEQQTLSGLKGLARDIDDLPAGMEWGDKAIDYVNERAYRRNKDRPLDHIRREFEESFQDFLKHAQQASDEELTDPERYPWTYGSPLWRYFEGDGYKHYREHAQQIRAWVKQG